MNLISQLNCSTLTDQAEISLVFKKGKKIKSDFGIIYCLNDKTKVDYKIAILIKKNVGKAFYRNYIKRIIKYYIRNHFTLLKKYNRVIFLYSYKEKIKYPFFKENITLALNKVS